MSRFDPGSLLVAARITVLLGKGQSLLNLDQAEEALACFDEVLALDASHPEALVKKGATWNGCGSWRRRWPATIGPLRRTVP